MKTAFKMLSDFETPCLNCPYCPSHARPTSIRSYSGRISKVETYLVVYNCMSKHQFFVEAKEKDER